MAAPASRASAGVGRRGSFTTSTASAASPPGCASTWPLPALALAKAGARDQPRDGAARQPVDPPRQRVERAGAVGEHHDPPGDPGDFRPASAAAKAVCSGAVTAVSRKIAVRRKP